MRLIRRIRYLFQQRREGRELAEEMELHRAMTEEQQRVGGVSAEEARYAARRLMGNASLANEDARQVWLAAWIGSVFQDLRYAARSLKSQPGFTTLALMALILGIGLNTSLFTVFNAVALRPWPVRDAGRMVSVLSASPLGGPAGQYAGFGAVEYRYLNEHSQTISGAFLERPFNAALDQQADGPRTVGFFVTGNYFSVLGVEMARGRGFAPEEDAIDAPQTVAVISYRIWQTRYGGDPNILGRRILLDDVAFTVIGVTGQDFKGTSPAGYDVWIPLSAFPVARPNEPNGKALLTDPNWCCLTMYARLATGVTREQARDELDRLSNQFRAGIGERPRRVAVASTALLGRPDAKERAIPVMVLFVVGVGAILLLACANVSNLLLARATARQREIAVRVAIGAGRFRLVRQLLTESLLLAAIASAFALLLAYSLPDFVLRHIVQDPPNVNLAPDPTVLAYTLGFAVLTAVAFGLAPALRGTRISVSDAMKQQSANSSPRFPLRGVLLSVQVAISVTLLVGAGLLIHGLRNARSLDPGFKTTGVTMVTVDLPVNSYAAVSGRVFFDRLLEDSQSQVAGPVGFAAFPPLGNGRNMTGFTLPGQTSSKTEPVLVQVVNGGYFDVLGIPIVAGRNLIPEDRERHNILINETMAKRYWRGQNPVGQGIIIKPDRREIVGVVRDSQVYGLGPVEPIYFTPFGGGQHGNLIVPASSAAAVAGVARRAESRAVVTLTPLSDQLDRWLTSVRAGAQVAAVLGLLALLLATIGVYGVIAYSVEQRRREIGVRMALGARPSEIVGLILKKNARAILCGLAIGLAFSLAGSKLLESSLYGVSRLDPMVYGGVIALLLLAGVAASAIPARRAARVDAVTSLHQE